MRLGLLCSGQGLQSPTMFDLVDTAPAAATVFAEARSILGRDPRELVRREGADLHGNVVGQILVSTLGAALFACIRQAIPTRSVVAGYSVGVMTAWHIAGAWSSADLLALTEARATVMSSAGGSSDRLAAVKGLTGAGVEALTNQFKVDVAILNPDGLYILGGPEQALVQLCDAALSMGADRANLLDVHVASHTSRLEGAVSPFLAQVLSRPLLTARPQMLLLRGADGSSVSTFEREAGGLARQIAHRLQWSDCLEAMAEAGATRVLELGPGDALVRMMRSLHPEIDSRSAADFRTLDGLKHWLNKP